MFLNNNTYLNVGLCLPVLGVVDGGLQLQQSSMNSVNEIEPATISILPFWTFFRDFLSRAVI
jgi:hypothetical protein